MSVPGNTPKSTKQPPKSTVILLLLDIANTTWRMFVPTLGGAALGWWVDSSWHVAPWGVVSGLIIGVVACAILIKQQFQDIKKNDY